MKTPNLLRVVCLLLLVGLWVESGPRVLAQSTPKTPAQRFLRGQKGIIRDTQTKLQWFDGFEDNATSSWDYANDWANNLHVDGWGWSLANRAQLKELYSSGQFGRLLKSSSTWTSELKDEDTAWGFLIAEGSEELGQKSDDNSFTGRIAVRSSAKRFTKDSDGIITDSWTRFRTPDLRDHFRT